MYGENRRTSSSTSPSTTSPTSARRTGGLDVEGLLRGIYRTVPPEKRNTAQILASGVAMPEALRAAELLADEWDVAADVWSVTSWGELNRDGVEIEKERCVIRSVRPARRM